MTGFNIVQAKVCADGDHCTLYNMGDSQDSEASHKCLKPLKKTLLLARAGARPKITL